MQFDMYWSFYFNNISCSETFPSKYINFLILSIYLTRKPFWANISIFWFYWYISLGNLSNEYIDFLILSIYLARETFLSEYIDYLILLIYLARKPFRANTLIYWFYWYILLENLSEQIYIDFLILLIYLAQKPFRANILIFWFYWYISLGNLFEQIYRFFDFTDISHLETFSSEYIEFSILFIYLARKPFRASISNFRFYSYISIGNLFEQVYRFLDFFLLSCLETIQASIFIFRVGP